MEESKEVKELTFFEKLISIASELKVPKSQYNDFGNYTFRSAEDILNAVKPLAFKHGLVVNLTDEIILVGDWHYVKATASITDGKEVMQAIGNAREAEKKKGMDESQISGTASSYARKYALNGLFLIDDVKDADTNEHRNEQENQPQGAQNEQEQMNQQRMEFINKISAQRKQLIKLGKLQETETWLLNKEGVSEIGHVELPRLYGYYKTALQKLEAQAKHQEQELPFDWGVRQ